MQKGILAILAVYVSVLLSGCDTLYPLKPVPHLEVFKDSSQLYCGPQLTWKVRIGDDGKVEIICGLVGGQYLFYGEKDTEPKRLPSFREVPGVSKIFCRSPADWEVRFYPKGSNDVAAVCGVPENRYNPVWYPWGGFGGYGWGYYRYPMW